MNTQPTGPQARRYYLAWFTQLRFLQEEAAAPDVSLPQRSEAFAEDLEDWIAAPLRVSRAAPARHAD